MQPGASDRSGPTGRDGATVRIHLLGRFTVELPGGRSAGPWARPSARRIVAILALAPGRRLSREAIAERLVPGLDPDTAARAVAKALSMARAAIERPSGLTILSADRSSVGLRRDGLTVDLDDLVERLRSGLSSPDGDLIEVLGALLSDTSPLLEDDPYEDWAMEARDDLDALRARARVARARALDRIGAPTDARIDAWQAVVAGDPTDEPAWVALISAERAAGRADWALRSSYQARAALREALDAEPGAELEALHRSLIGASGRPSEGARPDPARRTFGREHLLAWLDRRLTDLADGRGGDVILVGPAGIGKTRLLDEASDLATARGIRVGRGASVQEDRRVPYASFRQALRGLPIEFIPVKSRLARVLGRAAGGDGPGPGGSARDLALLTSEIIDAVEQLAQDRPVLLVLDDVQWTDPSLRSVLQRLVATPGRRRWAILAAGRSDEPDAPVPSGLGEVVTVPPLAPASIAALVREIHGTDARPDGDIDEAVERSGGNPLFAQELARAGPAADGPTGALPERIAGVIGRRFDQRSAAARRALQILALGDETVRNDLLLAVLGDEPGVLDALDELVGASLVEPVEEGYRFAHPLIREAAAGLMNRIRRARVHGRYADAIEAIGSDRPEMILRAVRHRVAAWETGRLSDDAGPAAAAAWRGARIVDEEFSADATRDLLAAGLAAFEAAPSRDRSNLAADGVWAIVRLGDFDLDTGDEDAARALYERALAIAGDDEARAAAWSAISGIPYRRGDMIGAAAALREGLATLHDDESVAAARLRSDLGWALSRTGDPASGPLLARSAAVLDLHGPPALASRALDRLAMRSPDIEVALDASDRAFVHQRRSGDRRELGVLLVHRAAIERRAGRLAAATRSGDEALVLFRAAADDYMESVCQWTRAETLDALGDLDAALAARDAEAAILMAIDNPRNLAGCQLHRMRLFGRLGRIEAARAAAGAAIAAAERVGDPALLADVRAWTTTPDAAATASDGATTA